MSVFDLFPQHTPCVCGDVITEVRCHLLQLIPHGRYTCTQGFVVDSRCDFTCDPGYRIAGQHSRTCQRSGSWSDAQPECEGTDQKSKQLFELQSLRWSLN